MASTSISAVTTLISGVEAVVGTITASDQTCTITGPSGGPLDFSTLAIRIANTSSSAETVTISVSSSYSSLDAGTYAVTIEASTTSIIGGTDFESARFKQVSAQSVILTFADGGTVSTTIEASQAPYSVTG